VPAEKTGEGMLGPRWVAGKFDFRANAVPKRLIAR
jgi:hypothetical protein